MSTDEFETLFKQYKTDIYRIAYTYVNNEADALDVVQETAYQAFISRNKIRDKTKFKSWLLKLQLTSQGTYLEKQDDII